MKNQYSQDPATDCYVSWTNDEDKNVAIAAMSDAVEEYGGFQAVGGRLSNFSNLDTNTSGRPGLTKRDYNYFRPGETVPVKIKDIIKAADKVYQKVSLIRNIIDLMGDFACQGVRLSHPDKRTELFYRNWFKKVKGKDRSERFLNNLYRTGNIVIRKQYAKLSGKQRARLFKTFGKPDIKLEIKKTERNQIPMNYIFMNPATVDVVGEQLAAFSNKKRYSITVPDKVRRLIQHPKTDAEKKLVKDLPPEIKKAAEKREPFLLPEDKTVVFHYKKDDWQPWALPMVYSLMEDIILLEKLKLADIAALDGAISNIRIFKLGSLEHKIAPARGAATKLKNVLQNHVGAGTIDIVWGPDIEMQESTTEVHKFLGPEKYIPTLNNIYGGMGIPPTLTGSFSAGGTTNNFISLKTLVQRLWYGRDILTSFWMPEIIEIQEAMGFSQPAVIEYDYPDLGDSSSEKAILIQMADRNLISDELLQERMDHNSKMENIRLLRERQEREDGKRVEKAGAFYDPQTKIGLQRVALQSMQLSPEQVGLEFDGSSRGPKDVRPQGGGAEPRKKGEPQQGRPKNSKDSTKRKEKTFKPKTKASVGLWASTAQSKIADVLNPGILHTFSKKNMRSLTLQEHQTAEKLRFSVLFSIEPFSTLNEVNVLTAFEKSKDLPSQVYSTYKSIILNATSDLNRPLTSEEKKHIQATLYADLLIGDEI